MFLKKFCIILCLQSWVFPSLSDQILLKTPQEMYFESLYPTFNSYQPTNLLNHPFPTFRIKFHIDWKNKNVLLQQNLILKYYSEVEKPLTFNTLLYKNYFSSLNEVYSISQDFILKKQWQQSISGQRSVNSYTDLFQWNLPVKIPAWLEKLDFIKPKVNISGSYQLLFEAEALKTNLGSNNPRWIPNLEIRQTPKFAIVGKIGDRITIEVNSENGFDNSLQDQLKINYKPPEDEAEDEIIQEIEIGNTSLSLGGTNLTGYTEQHEGLFGIKGKFKFGDLKLSLIASIEGSSFGSQSLKGTRSETEFTIQDIQPSLFRHFFLELNDRELYQDSLNGVGTAQYLNLKSNIEIEVWALTEDLLNQEADSAIAFALDANGDLDLNLFDNGRWIKLKQGLREDYDYNKDLKILNVFGGHENQILAVRWTNDPLVVKRDISVNKELSSQSPDTLILIKRNIFEPRLDSLMLRNIYSIGVVNTQDRNRFKLRTIQISNNLETDGTLSFNQQLGLTERTNSTTLKTNQNQIFDFDRGLLVLPCRIIGEEGLLLKPDGFCLEPLKRINSETNFYSQPSNLLNRITSTHEFIVTSRKSTSVFNVQTASHNLSNNNCIDITPNTERVLLNNSILLEKNKDYEVLYESGQIILISSRAKDPNANININYECEPLFQVEDDILLGGRVEYSLNNFSDHSLIGATLLYKKQTTVSNIPQLGLEPFDQFLWGFNLKLQNTSLWMTKFINFFSLIRTNTPSKYNFELEVAQSLYNGNLNGTAFIDDFERTERNYTFLRNRENWFTASPTGNQHTDLQFNENRDYRHQGRLIWHSNLTENFSSIFGFTANRETNLSSLNLLVLRFNPNDNLRGNSWGGIMQPIPSGLRNQSEKIFLEIVVSGQGGKINIDLGQISEDISIAGLPPNQQLDAEVLPGESVNRNDFGLDNLPDSRENSLSWQCLPECQSRSIGSGFEDPSNDNWLAPREGESNPSYTVNGTEGNNLGSNGLNFDTEDLSGNGSLNTTNEYLRYSINLNQSCEHSRTCETLESGWLRYEIPLKGEEFYQIISNRNTTPEQILLNTSFIRLWIDSLTNGVSESEVFIAQLRLKGNQWQNSPRNTNFDLNSVPFIDQTTSSSIPSVLQRDSNRLSIDVINNQDNQKYRASPQTVIERNADTDDPVREQSLVLRYNNLHQSEVVTATQVFSDNVKNLTQYDRLLIEVYPNNEVIPTNSISPYNVKLAFQLGNSNSSDSSNNYYEIKLNIDTNIRNLSPEQIWNRHRIEVSLSQLSSLKLNPEWLSQNTFSQKIPSKTNGDSLEISVIGNPSLANINWIRFVIQVNDSIFNGERQNGEIWLNDLRVEGINKSIGTSLRSFLQLDFSDVMSVGGNVTATDGKFTTLTQKQSFPSESKTRIDYSSNLQITLNKIFPDQWRVSLPMSFSFSGSIEHPFTIPSSDIFLQNTGISDILNLGASTNSSQSSFYQTTSNAQTLSLSYSKEKISDNLLTQFLLERPNIRWNFEKSQTNAPQQDLNKNTYRTYIAYDLSVNKHISLNPFGFLAKVSWVPKFIPSFQFNPYPNRFNFVVSDFVFENIQNTIKDIDNPLIFSRQNDLQVSLSHGLDLDWQLFTFFKFNYRINIQRDLDNNSKAFTKKNFFSNNEQGLFAHNIILKGEPVLDNQNGYTILFGENYRSQNFQANFNPKLIEWLNTSISFFSNYSHNRNQLTLIDSNQNKEFFDVGQSTHQFQFKIQWKLANMFKHFNSLTNHTFLSPLSKFLSQNSKKFIINTIDLTYSVRHNFSGEEFNLQQLNERNYSNLDLLFYQFGFVYDPAMLLSWSRFNNEFLIGNPRQTSTLDYLTAPLVDSNRIQLAHQINRDFDIKIPSIFFPKLRTNIRGSLGLNIGYTFHRDPLQQRNIDTNLVWPRYNLSTTFNSVEKWLPHILSKNIKKLNVSTSYIFKATNSFNTFNQNNERHSMEYNFNPLIKINGETQSKIRFSNSFNFSFTRNTFTPKVVLDSANVLSFRNFGENSTDVLLRLPTFTTTKTGEFTTRVWRLNNVFSIQKDLKTEKGFQFWKWYFRLQSHISLKNILQIGWNRTINDNFNLTDGALILNREHIRDELTFFLQPEMNYNFSDVDARFFLQYRYKKEFQTINQDTEHFIQFSAVFTIRL